MKLIGSAVDYLLGGPTVGGASEVRLRDWLALPEPQLLLPHARARYVVVDVETGRTGRRRDPLIAIGAAAVTRGEVELGDCFMTVLRSGRSAEAGIAGPDGSSQPQVAGIEPTSAMLDFLDYVGRAPLVVFAAAPIRGVVERAVRSILGVPFHASWIDLSVKLSVLFPEAGCATLAAWLDHFGLAAGARHDAVSNAYAGAQLLQIALVRADGAGMTRAADLLAPSGGRGRPDAR